MPKNLTAPAQGLSEGFHPLVLVDAVQKLPPDYAWLADALRDCGEGEWQSRAYVNYVDGSNPNKPGSEWQFQQCVSLNHETLGLVVIDVLKVNRLGGFEFVDKIGDD